MKNWHIICTAAKKELTVTTLLDKKGFECFCPSTTTDKKVSGSQTVAAATPIFPSYVFVHVEEEQLEDIKQITNVINIAYYQSKPVIVPEAEISAIKLLSDVYDKVSVEKYKVTENALVSIKPITIKKALVEENGIMVALPSLGFKLTASTEAQPRITVEKVKNKIKNSWFSNLFSSKLSLR